MTTIDAELEHRITSPGLVRSAFGFATIATFAQFEKWRLLLTLMINTFKRDISKRSTTLLVEGLVFLSVEKFKTENH